MSRRSVAPFLSKCLFALCCLNACAQQVIHVPSDQPTIQAGIDAASTGDTVLVAQGTYAENINFRGKGVIVMSGAQTLADAAKTIIHGSTDGPVVSIVSGEPAGTQLSGFTIEHGYTQTAAVGRAGGVYVESASVTLSYDVIQNNRGCGVGIVSGNATILQSHIRANTAHAAPQGPNQSYCATQGYGVYVESAGTVEIIGSEIDHNQLDTSLPAEQQGAAAGGILIASGQSFSLSSSYVHDNDFGLRVGFGSFASLVNLTLINDFFYKQTVEPRAGYSLPYPNVTEMNNTFWGRGQSFRLDAGTRYERLLLLNNIFANTGTSFGLRTDGAAVLCTSNFGGASDIRVENNDFYSATSQPSNCASGNGNISSNPNLRAPDNGDVHEQANSPTLKAGTISAPGLPKVDLDNKARTYCGTIDMGAYQYRPTTTTVSASRNPVNGGDTVAFTTQVASQCEPPTGQVTFYENGVLLGSGMLNTSGRTQLETSTLSVGDHTITASYTGSFGFDESTSNALTETVLGDPTTTTVTAEPSPTTAFSPITLRAVVASSYGTPSGTVTFRTSTGTLGGAPLDARGIATFISPGLGAGTYTIYADYSADIHFAASTGSTDLRVVAASSTTSLTITPPTSLYGQPVTLTTKVVANSSSTMGAPTGSIAFFDGSRPLGTASLGANGAVLMRSDFTVGEHAITARFSGNDSLAASSASATLSVAAAAVALSLQTASPTINQGTSAAVNVAGGSAYGSLAGLQVVLREGTVVLGTAQLDSSGRVMFSIQDLAPGTHILQATSNANATFLNAVSNTLTITVLTYDFSLSASTTNLAVPIGGYTYLTVTATPIGGFQGAIEVSCASVPPHAQCVFEQGDKISLNSGNGSLKFAINTSNVFGFGPLATLSSQNDSRLLMAVLLLPMFALPGTLFSRGRARILLAGAITVVVVLLQSCGGKQPAVTPSGTYDITIAGSTLNGTAIHKQITVTLQVK